MLEKEKRDGEVGEGEEEDEEEDDEDEAVDRFSSTRHGNQMLKEARKTQQDNNWS
ncbi:hypothetical protein Anapl_01082 [Anas platyrhynchos]|uniref:Uncharacterized protein n=1 Tax=Anas platyrhynchos TaxID=8839 RepID=R0L2E5_ANAPL|nr:hypothetical protein Anapl_01082 [Anas platyrhynchos]